MLLKAWLFIYPKPRLEETSWIKASTYEKHSNQRIKLLFAVSEKKVHGMACQHTDDVELVGIYENRDSPEGLIQVHVDGVNVVLKLPVKVVDQGTEHVVQHPNGEGGARANSSSAPERRELEVATLDVDVRVQESFWREHMRFVPYARVPPYGPLVDEDLGPLWDRVATHLHVRFGPAWQQKRGWWVHSQRLFYHCLQVWQPRHVGFLHGVSYSDCFCYLLLRF